MVFLSQVEHLYQGIEAITSSIVDRFAQMEIDAYKYNAGISGFTQSEAGAVGKIHLNALVELIKLRRLRPHPV